jgi:hypothetical protein
MSSQFTASRSVLILSPRLWYLSSKFHKWRPLFFSSNGPKLCWYWIDLKGTSNFIVGSEMCCSFNWLACRLLATLFEREKERERIMCNLVEGNRSYSCMNLHCSKQRGLKQENGMHAWCRFTGFRCGGIDPDKPISFYAIKYSRVGERKL